MSMGSGVWWQYAVILALGVLSLIYLFRQWAPRLANRWQAAVSALLTQPERGRAMQALGRWMRPRQTGGNSTGNCGDGCGTCGGCGVPKLTTSREDIKPLRFHPRQPSDVPTLDGRHPVPLDRMS
jgi:hypothetical protein